MNIAIICDAVLPARAYGGTERVVWDLAAALSKRGHKVTLLAKKGTLCPFANVVELQPGIPVGRLIPEDTDVAHFNNGVDYRELKVPYIVTIHGNLSPDDCVDKNAVFVSGDHARRNGSNQFVYNGLDWNRYPQVDLLGTERKSLHFLGKAAWGVKNMKGAVSIAGMSGLPIDILGGHRISLKMGLKITLDRNARFRGMVDDKGKAHYISQSRGLVFPVLWPEPFGLAITESMWFGAPLYGTPAGSLPELVGECGYLSDDYSAIADAIKNGEGFNPQRCREYVADLFNSDTMAQGYIEKYESVMRGENLNPNLNNLLKSGAGV